MKAIKFTLKLILFLVFVSFIFIFAITVYYLGVNLNVTLNESKLMLNTTKIEYYDENGQIIDFVSDYSNKNPIKLNELNNYTVNAFIAVEDKRFYSHKGIDYKRILKALYNNVKSLSFKEGASTISQQLIKNTHLSSEKTIKRKFNEIYLTKLLEKKYTKNQILELYLNTIYFGGSAYGIENASKLYFNKSAKNLSISESATLAGIIKSPSNYSPLLNYDNSLKRRNLVLNLMNKQGFISNLQLQKSYNEKINLQTDKNANYLKPYLNEVDKELSSLINLNPYDNNSVIKVYTYLNTKVQKQIFSIEIDGNFNRQQLIKNNKTSGIIAYFGENSNLKRSPASCIKPWYVYAPIINDKRLTESDVIIDEPINFNGYSPKNFNDKYYGAVTVKTALSKSLNTTAVKILNSYGVKNANNYAKLLGVDITEENLGSALGSISSGVSIKQLTDCYSLFANEGYYQKCSFINKITLNDKTVYANKNAKTKVFSEETAYIISDMLKETVESGTAKKLKNDNYTVYAKTGTNGNANGNLDAYTVCYTKNHTVSVWLGNYDNSLMDNKITGGSYPAIFASSALNCLYDNFTPEEITLPNGIITAKIDTYNLINNQKALLSDNGETFYYIKGTEPTSFLPKQNTPEVLNAIITVNGNTVSLNFELENANQIKIIRYFNNKKVEVFNGFTTNFLDNINNYGIYEYEIIPYYNDNDNLITGKSYVLPKISVSSKRVEIKDWWFD